MSSVSSIGVIDKDLLPKRALFDTSTLVCALAAQSREPHAIDFRDLFDALLINRKTILIAAPSLSELLRRSEASALPHREGIIVVPFDAAAARLFAERLPPNAITDAKSSGAPANYIKYDALIVACALRHRADVLITKDGKQTAMARAAQLRCASFSDFETKQLALDVRGGS